MITEMKFYLKRKYKQVNLIHPSFHNRCRCVINQSHHPPASTYLLVAHFLS